MSLSVSVLRAAPAALHSNDLIRHSPVSPFLLGCTGQNDRDGQRRNLQKKSLITDQRQQTSRLRHLSVYPSRILLWFPVTCRYHLVYFHFSRMLVSLSRYPRGYKQTDSSDTGKASEWFNVLCNKEVNFVLLAIRIKNIL
jgi:hypothetical protein